MFDRHPDRSLGWNGRQQAHQKHHFGTGFFALFQQIDDGFQKLLNIEWPQGDWDQKPLVEMVDLTLHRFGNLRFNRMEAPDDPIPPVRAVIGLLGKYSEIFFHWWTHTLN